MRFFESFSTSRSFAKWLACGCVITAAITLAGCPRSEPEGGATATGGSSSALTIISPHTREIQTEFNALWAAKNPGMEIKWLDQGGTSDALKFVREQFVGREKSKGIGVDLFFGGGSETFSELEHDGLLQSLPGTYGVPADLHGVPFVGKDKTWVAAGMSGFGILYNRRIAERDKLPVPATWADMANPQLKDRIELADPRHSGSAHTAYEIILQTNGWDKGWKLLTAMAGNARAFASSASQPLQDVQTGEAVFCPAIDFYASASIARAGADKLAYIQPKGQNILTPDPIGILQGAPNKAVAEKFVALVMSPEGQKLWYLDKGTPGGPKENTLFRWPAVPALYTPLPQNSHAKVNPFTEKTTKQFNSQIATVRRRALDDLFGTVLVDMHDQVKAAWRANPNMDKTGFVPMSETEFMKLAPKWDDPNVSSAKKSEWTEAATKHFSS